jgi:hypothetical protein
VPQVAAHDTPEVVAELDWERIVQPQLGAESRDSRRVGSLAHHLRDGVAGRDVQQQEGDNQDP